MTRPIRSRLGFLALLLALTMTRCGGDGAGPSQPVPSAIALVSGNAQAGTVGQALAQPLVARVTTSAGAGVPGVAVSWATTAGGGALSAGTATTDANGQASVTWTIGTTAGTNNNTATASVSGLAGSPVTFTATAMPAPASQLVAVSGNAQTAQVAQSIGQPLVVAVRDQYGNGITGVAVTWAVVSGGGAVSAQSVPTNEQAQSSVTWTLGTTAGSQTAQATLAGASGSPLNFTATATPGPATQLAISSGDNQTAPAATSLPLPLNARAADTYGNGVSGITVSWSVATGEGTLSATTSQTGTDGVATIQWTLGRFAGGQTVSASAGTLQGSPLTFTATATPNGTISGTVTVASGFLAPPLPKATTAGITLAAPARTKTVTDQTLSIQATAMPRNVGAGQSEFVPDELLITFRASTLGAPPPGSPAMASATTARTVGAAIRSRLSRLTGAHGFEVTGVIPPIVAARIRLADASRLDPVAASLRADPAIATVERNAVVRLDDYGAATSAAATLPNEPLYPWQAWHYGIIDLPSAWDITKGSASVLVAVVDGGIRFDHTAIAGNLTSDGYDFVSDVLVPVCGGGFISNAGDGGGYDPDPTIPADYDKDAVNNCVVGLKSSGAHGLHVAGTIGAVGNDAVGVTGVNWTVKIRSVRVFGTAGSTTDADIVNGILYAAGLPVDTGAGGPPIQAATPARIINMSFGGPVGSTAESLAVVAAKNAGALLVAAAGNNSETSPRYPAAFPEVLAVSAVGPSGGLATSYSNYAGVNGIAAPGGDFAAGGGNPTFGIMSTAWNFQAGTPIYDGPVGQWQGTSMAAPHVSGVAALLLAQNPALTATQLRSLLTSYAVPLGSSTVYGAGLLNARNSLTQSFAPVRNVYARLYDASTGAIVRTVAVAGNGSYAFTGLLDGNYYAFGGQDQNGDQQVGVPDAGLVARRWSAFGGTATPSTITVAGAGTYPASFSIALPTEIEPNNTTASAGALVVGGYMFGNVGNPSTDQDVYRILIPQAGQYSFQTSGWIGACRFALEEDTLLGLYDGNGSLITSDDDIDAANLNYCSRLTATLSPGVYYVGVFGYTGGNYRLQARSGP